MKQMKILVVDDEKKIANVLAERLEMRGFASAPAYDGTSALERLKAEAMDGMILDLRLPDIDGIEVLRQTRVLFPDLRVVILSGHANDLDFKTCLDLGAIACFQKPADIAEIIKTFNQREAF